MTLGTFVVEWVVPVLVSASIATLLTVIFAFRFRTWDRRGLLVGYFLLFFTLEFVVQELVLPPGALGIEIALVCFGIAYLFVTAVRIAIRVEKAEESTERPVPPPSPSWPAGRVGEGRRSSGEGETPESK